MLNKNKIAIKNKFKKLVKDKLVEDGKLIQDKSPKIVDTSDISFLPLKLSTLVDSDIDLVNKSPPYFNFKRNSTPPPLPFTMNTNIQNEDVKSNQSEKSNRKKKSPTKKSLFPNITLNKKRLEPQF